MVFTKEEKAARRARSELAAENENFKPRGSKNRAAFESLKKGIENQTKDINAHTTSTTASATTQLETTIKNQLAPINALLAGDGSDDPVERIKFRRNRMALDAAANRQDAVVAREEKGKAAKTKKAAAKAAREAGKAGGKAAGRKQRNRIVTPSTTAPASAASAAGDESSEEDSDAEDKAAPEPIVEGIQLGLFSQPSNLVPTPVEKKEAVKVAGPISLTNTCERKKKDNVEVSAEEATAYLDYLNNKNAEPYMDQLFGETDKRDATELRDILNKDRKEWISPQPQKSKLKIYKIMEDIARKIRIGLRPREGSLNHTLSGEGSLRVEHTTDWFIVLDKEILGVLPVNCSTEFD
jgi:hypothetical protein